jgi:hypothetical protein
MTQKVKKVSTFLTSKMVKIVISYPFTGIFFFKLKIQSAQFLNRIDSLHVNHKKKTKK